MPITDNQVVHINYTLRNDQGEELDASPPGQPLAYLHGQGNIIPGLESALAGRESGDTLTVTVPPEQAYGPRHEELVQDVPREAFQGIDEIQPGMRFQAESNQGPRPIVVTKVEGETITVDGNHPLAGEELTFEVEVAEIRSATDEELEHGHVHGPGGHEH